MGRLMSCSNKDILPYFCIHLVFIITINDQSFHAPVNVTHILFSYPHYNTVTQIKIIAPTLQMKVEDDLSKAM